ncbi:LuxR C-terminal-related transcriptional regulator [Haloactinomyces albus]|uniref:DNA-binding CsgD family transcriptional regulator n=1 Tax=Haloactinomyces albus TaxID=1352928 RepID=A0AAE3ZBA2_9ACTN|nr:LuxR C-terminal-related transcriptional regulator [Haloactinomyces albus]MDR7301758.1 DNA-binding CsgD family transcriptional regulator [Haloactinomyces albus]
MAVSAAALRESIAADPTAPVVAGIQGSGGYGKTALLARLARIYRDAGITVYDTTALPADPSDAAVLVDDAHRIDEATLRTLEELAENSATRLVVAYRPWPRSEALAALVGALGRRLQPILLRELNRGEIAEQAETALGAPVTSDLVEHLRSRTGGVPRLVSRLLSAVDSGDIDSDGNPGMPQAVLDRFHHDLDQFGGHARDCLVAVALGATAHPALLASALDVESTAVTEAMSAVRASGLVDAHDGLLPVARDAVLALTPWQRRLEVLRRLIRMQLDRGGSVLALVQPLLGAESALLSEPTMAAAFEKAGDEAWVNSPELAVRLFDAAVSAGTAVTSVAARRARAAAAAGDLDEALRTADQVIVDDAIADRDLGIRVAAAVLAHRGLLARSTELCRWSVEHVRWSGDVAFAVLGMTGTGRLEEAGQLLRSPADVGPPTTLSGAAAQLAEGMHESVTGSATTALSTLVRSASLSESIGRTVLLPDTPAAVASVVALHCGEFDVAESTLDRAIESGTGGALLRTRHHLLSAWVPLLRGDTMTARNKLAGVYDDAGALATRDRLVAIAIEAGIANRDNDMTALADVRSRARKIFAEHPVDLFTMLPLGELVVATARLRDQEWLTPYLREARYLLGDLGTPPLWSAMLHWKCLQAAVVLEQHDRAREHAAALEGMAHHTPLSTAMSDGAQVWLNILAGEVDQSETERAARSLHSAGLVWDGANLAGQAAVRTTDRRVMPALLECARTLQGKAPRPQKLPAAGRGSGSASAGGADLLSDREREVAELVLAGYTYKQVGKRLFISAKTVEHHIGRIKQRLGSTTREEMLTRLRALVD